MSLETNELGKVLALRYFLPSYKKYDGSEILDR